MLATIDTTPAAAEFHRACDLLREALATLDSVKWAGADMSISGPVSHRHAVAKAAWRIADAGLLLRVVAEAIDLDGFGITEPTGFGVMLPVESKETA